MKDVSRLLVLILLFCLCSYLQECGFVHSAFSFVNESMLRRTGLRSADKTVPPGALVTFLQKGLQYVGIEESLNQEASSNNNNNYNSVRAENDVDFTLLSPTCVAALTRQNPPIQLNVPPATAAAAVRARLEAQAKLDEERRSQQFIAAAGAANGALENPVAQTATAAAAAAVLDDPNAALARQALAAQAAAAHAAAAMSQLQQMGQPAVADALIQQQRVAAAADIMALQQQQHQLVGHHLPLDGVQSAALVQQQQQQHLQQQQQQQQQSVGKRTVASGTKRNPKKQKMNRLETIEEKRSASGFASLEEAVAQLEAKNNKKTSEAAPSADAMDVEMNDGLSSVPAETRSQELVHLGQSTDDKLPTLLEMNGEPARNGSPNHVRGENGEIEESQESSSKKDLAEVDDSDTMAKENEVLKFDLHQSEVFMCAWNPIHTNLIATGSGDASARLWEVNGLHAANGLKGCKLLPHGSDTRDLKNKDVTTLEWSSDGEFLATGSYDGVARIWSRSGALLYTLRGHNGPIFSLKWNGRGNYLLSGSYDHTTIVWNVSESTGLIRQQYTDHTAPALDVDWRDDETFASCSTDTTVHVCRVGTQSPMKIFTAHTDEVNAVEWDPTKRFLASCSDDKTAKIWEVDSDRMDPLYDFILHKEEVYTLKWCTNTNKKPLLATASFDSTVMLWNIEDGSRYRVLARHHDSVYSVAFSPSGDYIATGSLAGQMYIWDIESGRQVKSYRGDGDIFEVAWNKEETRVASCFSNGVVAVVDFDKSQL